MLSKENKIWLIILIVAVGFWVGVAYAYYWGFYFGAPFPKNTFLCVPSDVGNDFFNMFKAVQAGDPYGYQWSVYLPFTYIPIYALSIFPRRVAYVIFAAVFLVIVVTMIYRALKFLPQYARCAATFVLCFFSYPVLLGLDRGNFEFMIFIALFLFLENYQRGNLKWGVVCLACATSMKLYPFVFATLLFQRRQYKLIAAAVALVVILTLGSAALYPGGIAGTYRSFEVKVPEWKKLYVLEDNGLPYTSSYFSLLKVVTSHYQRLTPDQINQLLPWYTLGGMCLFGLLAFYLMYWEPVYWKKVAILSCSILLLPQVAVDYKLIHLFFPMLLFIAAEAKSRFDLAYAALFGLLLIPKAFLWIKYRPDMQMLPLSNFVNPLLLTALILLIVLDRFLPPAHSAPLAVEGSEPVRS
jgi:hypothetical protein